MLGDVLAGKTFGRRSGTEITLFESLGVAIEDLACASLVYERALAQGLGTIVDL
jgi:ornithine cyclodeaminase/alanine dehydrogenase-like protein (mu-crystallin family)